MSDFTAKVFVTDDDGGVSATVSTVVNVGGAGPAGGGGGQPFPALWANNRVTVNGLDVSGSGTPVKGLTHSNRDIKVSGSGKSFTGGTEYVNGFTASGSNNTFTPGQTKVVAAGFPVTFTLADYRPGGKAAVAADAGFKDMSAQCSGRNGNRKWQPSGNLADGLYYVNCAVQISGSQLGAGKVTIAAEGAIKVSGSGNTFARPFVPEGALFVAGDGSDKAVDLSGSGQTYGGAIFAGSGGVSISGSGQKFVCGIEADTIRISGSGSTIDTSTCPFSGGGGGGNPITVAAPPLLVPNLNLAMAVDAPNVVPGQKITYTENIANNGTRLLVPGIFGFDNTAASGAATVTGSNFVVEYFDIASKQWKPLAASNPSTGNIDVSSRSNPTSGVTYPSAGDPVNGTVVQPGSVATWAPSERSR